jgi:hypothetical protein
MTLPTHVVSNATLFFCVRAFRVCEYVLPSTEYKIKTQP